MERYSDITIIKEFNKLLRLLLTKVELVYNTDDFYVIKSSISKALQMRDVACLEYMGPVLFEYKDKILEDNINYFLNMDLENKYPDYAKLIKVLKDTFNKADEDFQITLARIIKEQTILYAKYKLWLLQQSRKK